MTTSELAENGPALFNTSAICLILATVPLHFQLPPIKAFAIFPDIFCGRCVYEVGLKYIHEARAWLVIIMLLIADMMYAKLRRRHHNDQIDLKDHLCHQQ